MINDNLWYKEMYYSRRFNGKTSKCIQVTGKELTIKHKLEKNNFFLDF